jgi:hypothetical protein
MKMSKLLKQNGYSVTGADSTKRKVFTNPKAEYNTVIGCGPTGDHSVFTVRTPAGHFIDIRHEQLISMLSGVPDEPKCECGSAAVGSRQHSDWCAMVTK